MERKAIHSTAGGVLTANVCVWLGATYMRVTGKLGHDHSLVDQSLFVRSRKISSAHFDGDIVCWPPPFARLVERTPGIKKENTGGQDDSAQILDGKARLIGRFFALPSTYKRTVP
jgi:hypothetical protein